MLDAAGIDMLSMGWGLQLDKSKQEAMLEDMLWRYEASSVFLEDCGFIFAADRSKITLKWTQNQRSVTIQLKNGNTIQASV